MWQLDGGGWGEPSVLPVKHVFCLPHKWQLTSFISLAECKSTDWPRLSIFPYFFLQIPARFVCFFVTFRTSVSITISLTLPCVKYTYPNCRCQLPSKQEVEIGFGFFLVPLRSHPPPPPPPPSLSLFRRHNRCLCVAFLLATFEHRRTTLNYRLHHAMQSARSVEDRLQLALVALLWHPMKWCLFDCRDRMINLKPHSLVCCP